MNILILLKENVKQLDLSAKALQYSIEKSKLLAGKLATENDFSFEEADIIEAYSSRIARCSDILIHKVLKAVQQYDSEISGTIRDLLQQSEKKGLISDASLFLELRAFRNELAHDYLEKSLHQILENCNRFATPLMEEVKKVIVYCDRLTKTK
jgi:uncharacterized protein YutE (UPF0331/DUF86 family)